jgi:MYXO-CTERM domain-containing protein
MGVVNKRNAFLGWAVWKVGKRVAKRKAKSVVASAESPSGRGKGIGKLAALAAAVGGGLLFWRRSRGDESPPEPPPA